MIKNVIIGVLAISLWITSTSNTTSVVNTNVKLASISTFNEPLLTLEPKVLDSIGFLSPQKQQASSVSFTKYSDGIITSVLNIDTVSKQNTKLPVGTVLYHSEAPTNGLWHKSHGGNYKALSTKNSWMPLDSSWEYTGQKIHTDTRKQWFAFDTSWRYEYTPIRFSERELNMFTNILYRESGSYSSIAEEIDCYFVAIVILRRVQEDGCSTPSCMLKSGLFRYTQSMFDKTQYKNETWVKCREIMSNVFKCNVPAYIPYIPHGTFCYWNSRLDEAWPWRKRIEKYYVNVASTIKDHHYYSDPRAMTIDEKAHLYVQYEQHNKMNPIFKNIANGDYNLLLKCDK